MAGCFECRMAKSDRRGRDRTVIGFSNNCAING